MQTSLGTVGIVGTGLIGTSLALALRAHGVRVLLADRSTDELELAVELSGAEAWTAFCQDHGAYGSTGAGQPYGGYVAPVSGYRGGGEHSLDRGAEPPGRRSGATRMSANDRPTPARTAGRPGAEPPPWPGRPGMPAPAGSAGGGEGTGSGDELPPGSPAPSSPVSAGGGGPGGQPAPEVVFACVPPPAVAAVLLAANRLAPEATLSDVASVKSQPQVDSEAAGLPLDRYVGGHPVAGRELSGARAGRADLFAGRPWALCPSGWSRPERVAQVAAVVRLVGAVPVVLSAQEHDAAMAWLSHLPQLLASALAAVTAELPGPWWELAGAGFADMTRLAASPPTLWAQIAAANAAPIGAALTALRGQLDELAGALSGWPGAAPAVAALVARGAVGRSRVPVKPGLPERGLTWVSVVLQDRPGELAAVLQAAAAVNVEDIRIDHAPHQPAGVVELAVPAGQAAQCARALEEKGWRPVVKPMNS